MAEDETISEPVVTATLQSFGKRLRAALEKLPEGEAITIRTKKERSQVSNIITKLRNDKGLHFRTRQVSKREDSPEGYMVLEIKRLTTEEVS